jgi:hypothetical protein
MRRGAGQLIVAMGVLGTIATAVVYQLSRTAVFGIVPASRLGRFGSSEGS